MKDIFKTAIFALSQKRRFITYVLCGGAGVLTDITIYSMAIMGGIYYQWSNLIGYASGTLISFFLNRHFTFKTYDKTVVRLLKFYGVAGLGYGVSALMLWWLIGGLSLNAILAKVLTLGVVLLLQYSLNKYLTFGGPTLKKFEDRY